MRAINWVILPSMAGSSRTGDLIAGQVAGFATLDAAAEGASARAGDAVCPDAGAPSAKAAMARPANGAPLRIISTPYRSAGVARRNTLTSMSVLAIYVKHFGKTEQGERDDHRSASPDVRRACLPHAPILESSPRRALRRRA
ncbi:hypothetical protein, partial [Sphingomonas mali]|uniref:hypothetical protein n=1 Tax=Sphingomonas mali TaxID=40682 RepID=UPI001FDF4017